MTKQKQCKKNIHKNKNIKSIELNCFFFLSISLPEYFLFLLGFLNFFEKTIFVSKYNLIEKCSSIYFMVNWLWQLLVFYHFRSRLRKLMKNLCCVFVGFFLLLHTGETMKFCDVHNTYISSSSV